MYFRTRYFEAFLSKCLPKLERVTGILYHGIQLPQAAVVGRSRKLESNWKYHLVLPHIQSLESVPPVRFSQFPLSRCKLAVLENGEWLRDR